MVSANESMLLKAAESGDVTALRSLLETGTDPSACEEGENSALILAADGGHLQAVQALIEHGADANYQNELGDTALICASVIGRNDIVRALLAAGAFPDLRNKMGASPRDYAVHHHHAEVASTLNAVLEERAQDVSSSMFMRWLKKLGERWDGRK